MLFLEPDMASFAARARGVYPPGTVWNYTTTNTAILARIVLEATGGDPVRFRQFLERELLAPLGVTRLIVEFDAAGTPQRMYATPRDWARLARLYLEDGVIGGRRILPAGWVAYTTAPTLGTGYGAGWWLGGRHWRPDWGLPDDAFNAAGHLHQKVLVVPSAGVVIARTGLTTAADDGFGVVAQEILAALRETAQGS